MYYWLYLPSLNDPRRFSSLQDAVRTWVGRIWDIGKPELDGMVERLRRESIFTEWRPNAVEVYPATRKLMSVIIIYTDEPDLPVPDDENSDADSDVSDWMYERPRWQPPGPMVDDKTVLETAADMPDTHDRLCRILRQITLIERMAQALQDSWAAGKEYAPKIRWYERRGLNVPFALPETAWRNWTIDDVPLLWPPVLVRWKW